MNIEKAKQLVIGDRVSCPSDRGDSGYVGKVHSIGADVCTHMDGPPFLWITVTHPNGKARYVWPSNRLG